ncbi:MAG TPA: DUF1810 domain-containing protein [Hymenobacter sp.]|jgi:uncharacterized protein (DUF1810 family)
MIKESNLKRFINAQASDYQIALSEIRTGQKRNHWMWYIFPQIQGLGFSETSKYYAIKDTREAEDFLNHPVLGTRLVQICNELVKLGSSDATRILGSPDDLKLRSSMTLFASITTNSIFQQVLDKFFAGKKDRQTLQLIGKE